MARRSDHTREELKNLSIQAGYAILKAEGLTGFSIRKVARAIGYSVGTLYNVFDTYEVFMLHVQAAILDDWFENLQKSIGRNKNKEPLYALASAYMDYGKKNYNIWSVLFAAPSIAKEQAPAWYKEKLERFFRLAEESLASVITDPEEKKKSARLLWAAIHGICVLALSGKLDLVADESAERMAHHLIATYLAGLTRHA